MGDSVEEMLDDGSLILAGISDDGEQLYIFTDICKELHPAVWERKYQEFKADVNELYLLGYIDIEVGSHEDEDNIIINDRTFVDDPTMPAHLRAALDAIRDGAREEYGLEKDG